MERGYDAPLFHAFGVGESRKFLSAQALLAIQAQDYETAIESIQDLIDLGNTLRGEPLMVSMLVRQRCLRSASHLLERLLNRVPAPPPALHALVASLDEDTAALRRAYLSDLAIWLE
jgi:hypothetical protein